MVRFATGYTAAPIHAFTPSSCASHYHPLSSLKLSRIFFYWNNISHTSSPFFSRDRPACLALADPWWLWQQSPWTLNRNPGLLARCQGRRCVEKNDTNASICIPFNFYFFLLFFPSFSKQSVHIQSALSLRCIHPRCSYSGGQAVEYVADVLLRSSGERTRQRLLCSREQNVRRLFKKVYAR